MFIWIKFVEQSIRELGLTSEGITVNSVSTIPSGLNNVYKKYFTTLFKGLGSNQTLYQDVIALALLAPRALIPELIWKQTLGFGESEDENERFNKLIVELCSKLLLFDRIEGGSNERVLKPPHKSLLDWSSNEAND